MKKSMIILSAILIFFMVLFSNCKSSQTEAIAKAKEDSLRLKFKTDSQKITNELSKYAIEPPNSDYTGDYMDRYANGVIKFTGFFRFGVRHGQWMAFYDNGIKWSECFYDKGKRHGASMVYYPNGKLQYSGWFKNDLRDSLWFFYDKDGKEIDRRAFRDDVETGLVN